MKVELLEYPTEQDWIEVKRRALVTVGKMPKTKPTLDWKINEMLRPRHSPIRYLRFCFKITDIPYCISVHFCRHVHAQPYVKSQRNDRQEDYDRNSAPQNAPVTMIYDCNGEELMAIMNKRLCKKADKDAQLVAQMMREEVMKVCPEYEEFLVPMCYYLYGHCNESKPCGYYKTFKEKTSE